jgi:hypothetical protein
MPVRGWVEGGAEARRIRRMKQITDYGTEGMKNDSDDRKIHGSDEETRKDIPRGWMTKPRSAS